MADSSSDSQLLVYFEKQTDACLTCGVHCLNMLLQGPLFTEMDLAAIGEIVRLSSVEAALLLFIPLGRSPVLTYALCLTWRAFFFGLLVGVSFPLSRFVCLSVLSLCS